MQEELRQRCYDQRELHNSEVNVYSLYIFSARESYLGSEEAR